MGRFKNAMRQHFIAVIEDGDQSTEPTEWLPLAARIFNVEDESEDNLEDYSDYAGDGTIVEDIVGVSEAYNFSGQYDSSDAAQKVIAGMKRKTGEDRKLWHKIVTADEKEEIIGVAVVSEIVAGAGEASEYELFECRIAYTSIPEVRDHEVTA